MVGGVGRGEAERFALGNKASAHVGGHQDDRVFERDLVAQVVVEDGTVRTALFIFCRVPVVDVVRRVGKDHVGQ